MPVTDGQWLPKQVEVEYGNTTSSHACLSLTAEAALLKFMQIGWPVLFIIMAQ